MWRETGEKTPPMVERHRVRPGACTRRKRREESLVKAPFRANDAITTKALIMQMLCSAGVDEAVVGSQVIKQTCNANDVFSTSFSAAAASSTSTDAMALAAAAAQRDWNWNSFAGHPYPASTHIQYPNSHQFQFLFPTQTVDWGMGYHHVGAAGQHQMAQLGHIPTHSPTSAALATGNFASLHPLQQQPPPPPIVAATTETGSPAQSLSTLTLNSAIAQPLQVGHLFLHIHIILKTIFFCAFVYAISQTRKNFYLIEIFSYNYIFLSEGRFSFV